MASAGAWQAAALLLIVVWHVQSTTGAWQLHGQPISDEHLQCRKLSCVVLAGRVAGDAWHLLPSCSHNSNYRSPFPLVLTVVYGFWI